MREQKVRKAIEMRYFSVPRVPAGGCHDVVQYRSVVRVAQSTIGGGRGDELTQILGLRGVYFSNSPRRVGVVPGR